MGCAGSKSKSQVPPPPPVTESAAPNTNNTNNTNNAAAGSTNANAVQPASGGVGGAVPGKDDDFINGKPSDMFPYDEIRKCTERGNGLLFRLINFSTKQWAFYNDSKIYEFHVTVVFSDQCSINALGNTTVVTDPHSGRAVAKVVVYPGMTEPFVQGHIDGFDAEYQAVGLTDEYKKMRQRQKKAAKEQKKAEKKGGGNVENDELDEPADMPR